MKLTNETMRECLSYVIEARAGADETARILSQTQRGDQLSFLAIADALDVDPGDLFNEVAAEVYYVTGKHMVPVPYAEGRRLQ